MLRMSGHAPARHRLQGTTAPGRLGSSVCLVLCHATGDPLPMVCDGNLLRTHRAGIRFDDIPTDALDVAALRGPMGHGTRWLVSMVGHAAPSSRDGASRDAVGRCSRLQRHDYVSNLGAIRDDACGRAGTTDVYRSDPGEIPSKRPDL